MIDAQEIAARTAAALVRALEEDGHECSMAHRAEAVANADGEQVVVCGCGYFVELPDNYLSSAFSDLELANKHEPGQVMPPGSDRPAEIRAADIVTPAIPLVDPTQILTPDALAAHIVEATNRLERGAAFALECIQVQFETKRKYTLARAHAIADSQAGSADRRDAEALVKCEELYNDMVRADMMARAAREMLHNLRSILSGYQSTGRAVTATFEAGGSPSSGRLNR